MTRSVRAKADTVATWRHTAVFLMETLARWVPTSPEFEAKALFGRHVWELAQHADAFGRRTAELRAALHESRPPVPAWQQVLDRLAATAHTPERLEGMYDAVLPDLERRYGAWLAGADALMDEPTIRIVERALTDCARMRRERDALLAERPDLRPTDGAAAGLTAAAASCAEMVDFRPAPAAVA